MRWNFMSLVSVIWLLEALLAGALGYIGSQILSSVHKKLDELRQKPLESTDQDLEELLTHLMDELGDDVDGLSVQDSLRIIRLRIAVSRLYWQLYAQKFGMKRPRGSRSSSP
jgi:hypothetical protein